jgi:ABC-type glycerol-3-phosphate transport system permease component
MTARSTTPPPPSVGRRWARHQLLSRVAGLTRSRRKPANLGGGQRQRVAMDAREGLLWARLSAATTLAVVPVPFASWVAQRYLVRGRRLGAVK